MPTMATPSRASISARTSSTGKEGRGGPRTPRSPCFLTGSGAPLSTVMRTCAPDMPTLFNSAWRRLRSRAGNCPPSLRRASPAVEARWSCPPGTSRPCIPLFARLEGCASQTRFRSALVAWGHTFGRLRRRVWSRILSRWANLSAMASQWRQCSPPGKSRMLFTMEWSTLTPLAGAMSRQPLASLSST